MAEEGQVTPRAVDLRQKVQLALQHGVVWVVDGEESRRVVTTLLLGAENRLIFPLTLALSPIGGEGKK